MSDQNFQKAQAPLGVSIVWDKAKEKENWVFLGTQIVGKYTGKRENVGQYESTIYELEIDGKPYTLWANKVLEDKFERGANGRPIPLGSTVRVTWLRSQKPKTGMKAYDVFEVEFIPGNGFAVAGGQEGGNSGSNDAGY